MTKRSGDAYGSTAVFITMQGTLFPLCLAFLVGASAKGIVAPAEHSVLEPLKIKQADKATALLDINQIVYIENSPVLGGGAGEGALNNCQAFAAAHVANPATPEVKVCGTGIKATFFLRGRCQEYSSHYSKILGQCNSKLASNTCESWSPANDPTFGAYQSYLIEPC